ncbi:MAG: hypothetical protein CSA62_05030 [Planctomycetota bacterium]|nr:MAG: hypothetical protein CSA62_05030 [Planctomycetota bacterium]
MDPILIWVMIAAFYAPIHFAIPALIVLLTGNHNEEQRRRRLRHTMLHCAVDMLIALALAGFLFDKSLPWSMAVLAISMLLPYPILLLSRHAQR